MTAQTDTFQSLSSAEILDDQLKQTSKQDNTKEHIETVTQQPITNQTDEKITNRFEVF